MPENIIPKREQIGIEKLMLCFYFICNVTMTIIGIRFGWSIWLLLLMDAGWLFGLVLHLTNFRTYEFRAYVIACMMQMGAVVWSVSTESLSMTVPVLSIVTVMLVLYGIPEIVYITIAVASFLCVYHLLLQKTVDLSSGDAIIQTVLEIFSLYLINYIVFFLIKKRLEGIKKQMDVIISLKAAERSKDDFMANVSHEIRTPINTICGMSEIVLREELSSQVRADVFTIQTAGRNLQSIVSDVLDFTEMQTGKMTLVEEAYNITSTINDVINMSMARKNEKELDLVVDCDANLPSGLIGDEQKIRRVIMNLVNNALKFTAEGCVTIVIGARKTDYGINLVVRIKDTGIGMKKESLEKLFTNFNQVDTKRNRQEEGIGLGLAISQALVDMMGGFITVSSEFGKGSEIQFVVPQKVMNPVPIVAVKDRERLNVAIYVDMEKYDRPEVREAYSQVIFHMIEQLKVRCHVCQNLSELKRRVERETFTHVFISIEEYEEDTAFFDNMSRTTKVITIIERANEVRIANPQICRLYKPFFILPIVRALNDEKLMQGIDANYFYEGKFTAPDACVLVVDDNLMNIRVLEGLLRPYKVGVAIATSGAEALEKIENMSYDVVFMDHMMPEMDGVETLQRIRQKQGSYYKKVPIVAVTANAVGGMREVFLREGFRDFIAKPIEVSVLERVLKRVLPQDKLIPVEDEPNGKPDELKAREDETKQKEETTTQQEEKEVKEAKEAMQRYTDLPVESFDEQTGITYCGSPEDYIEILQMISGNGQEDCKKICRFYEEKDWKNYATLVHALKSTMLSVGVEKLSGMAKELELAGKSGDESFILEHHDAMIQEYTRILGLLKESKTVHPQKEKELPDGLEALEESEFDKLALDFEDAAFAFDHGQMTAIAKQLVKCSFRGHALADMMGPIMHKIEMEDYLSASEAVARLKDRIGEND
ncbi:MAG: response regulator [Lachnospiraceae bacterium]|nr:response regulator [Lachnospiraceae bacterium]